MSRENEKQKSGNAFINALKKSNMTAMAAILVVMIIIAIKACLREIFGDVADEIPVLYGGSVNPGNANELIVQPSIDGLFTGRAAWQADNFDKLIRDAKATYEAK